MRRVRNPLLRDRRIKIPPDDAERECRLVSYAMPLLRHCFVLCDEPANPAHPAIDYTVMECFMGEAYALSRGITGNPYSFVVIHSGGLAGKRPNLHMRRRWQKAWLYLLLTTIHSLSALRRALRRSFRTGPVATSDQIWMR